MHCPWAAKSHVLALPSPPPPSQVAALQWSPALPDPADGRACRSSTPPLGASGGSGGSGGQGLEQLTLMTVGVDRLIRVWVEVKIQDLLPAHLTKPPPPRGEPPPGAACRHARTHSSIKRTQSGAASASLPAASSHQTLRALGAAAGAAAGRVRAALGCTRTLVRGCP